MTLTLEIPCDIVSIHIVDLTVHFTMLLQVRPSNFNSTVPLWSCGNYRIIALRILLKSQGTFRLQANQIGLLCQIFETDCPHC